ncbi:BRCA1-associated protein-like isoform X2 [Hydractinia symbiolongicarpus]|uniref:BRCA1-associated protein-like isoform X2 n=1 Tax=Hydractinia symbiolongicarpus TaxID=13093 RepID=UPI00254F8BBE|nr:BRCA1-associated protein-like isoform X2 [Hydractinia symbiolongicarpus]
MRVSLVVLRLEVAEGYQPLETLSFKAEKYLADSALKNITKATSDLSLTLQSEPVEVPNNFKDIPELHIGKRKYHDIAVTTYNQEMDLDENPPLTDECRLREQRISESAEVSAKNVAKSPLTIQYFSGNPTVETTRGIMHLYKDGRLTPMDSDISRSELLCMLGVPAKFNCQDLQKYIEPARDTIEHIKIIRDSIPNQYMVLLKFKDQQGADTFYQEYEGRQYNMLETECSHLVYVSRVESMKSTQGGYLPVKSLTELPTCPVCLERMDESVAGILTVLCNHSFHNECLMKWQDSCCPVCRYCQTPEPSSEQSCFECDSKESLWICLICGYVGCGRYQEQHAYQHYQKTAHTFSMQLGNQRVWDYAGDNYVHRLIQSKGDGKLVALNQEENIDYGKMDSLTLEYTYLLTNQLESQRLYFEEKIGFMEKDAYDKISMMEASLHDAVQSNRELERKYMECKKDKKAVEKKYENVVAKATKITKELRDERQMNTCLRENQSTWQTKVEELERKLLEVDEKRTNEIQELQSQVFDLMKHLELQSAVGNAEHGVKEDIQGGQVFLDQAEASPSKSGTKSRKTRKR